MANPSVENIGKTNADALAKSGQVAETIMKGSTTALTESGNASRAGVQELTKGHCHINRFYCSLLGYPLNSDSIESML